MSKEKREKIHCIDLLIKKRNHPLFGYDNKAKKAKKKERNKMVSAELLTGLGAAASIFFASVGAALASAPAGVFALRSSTYRAFIPIVIAGVLAIYGIIVAVLLASNLKNKEIMTESDGYKQLAAGLSVGLACLASGLGMVSAVHNDGNENNVEEQRCSIDVLLTLYFSVTSNCLFVFLPK